MLKSRWNGARQEVWVVWMLKLLHIDNIAVIEKADIEFIPGLNVLTGETGAGK